MSDLFPPAGTGPLIRELYGVAAREPPDPAANFERFVSRLERDRTKGWPVVVVIDGWKPGAGKSTLGIHLCRRLDPGFDIAHVVYSAAEVHHAYETLPPGSMVLYDESVLGLLSRKGSRDEELSGLVMALAIVRKHGVGTILTVPKIRMLDTLVYNGLAPYWIYIEDRGRGRVHRAHKGPRYRNSQRMIAYDRYEAVSPLGWDSLDRDVFFKAYKARAIDKGRAFFQEQQHIAEARRRRLLGEPRQEPRTSSGDTGPDRPIGGGEGGSLPHSACRYCGRGGLSAWNLSEPEGACAKRPLR